MIHSSLCSYHSVVQSSCPMWVSRAEEQQLQILKIHISILSCYFSPFTFSDAYQKVVTSQLDKAACRGVAAQNWPCFEGGLKFMTFGSAVQNYSLFFIEEAHPWHIWHLESNSKILLQNTRVLKFFNLCLCAMNKLFSGVFLPLKDSL